MNTNDVNLWTVEVCTGTVTHDGAAIQLTPREAELVFAVAAYPRSSVDQLAGRLWPDSDTHDGANLVKVYVHRVRRRVGWDAFITRDQRGYRLAPTVRTDFQSLGQLPAVTGRHMQCEERRALAEMARRLRIGRPAYMLAWEWFAPIDQQLSNAGHDIAIGVARAAIEASSYREALGVLGQLTCEDPCDEEARELTIRALLLEGNQSAAMREYRRYTVALRQELDALPSPQLRALFVNVERAGVAV